MENGRDERGRRGLGPVFLLPPQDEEEDFGPVRRYQGRKNLISPSSPVLTAVSVGRHLPNPPPPPRSQGRRQGARGPLPEVRRRGRQEGGQGRLRPLRPHPPRRRPPALRAQEVRRARHPRPVPEVVPLSVPGQCGCCPIDGSMSRC
jgi:hypothetical protein